MAARREVQAGAGRFQVGEADLGIHAESTGNLRVDSLEFETWARKHGFPTVPNLLVTDNMH